MSTTQGFFDTAEYDHWEGGSYNWFHVELNLFQSTRADLLRDKENAGSFPTLIHEYTHFLQSFTTAYGFTTLFTYISCVNQFRMENMRLLYNPSIPLKGGKADKRMKNKNLKNIFLYPYTGVKRNRQDRTKILYDRSNESEFHLKQDKVFVPYRNKTVVMANITVEGFEIKVSEFVIRESMAYMSNFLATSLTSAERHELFLENDSYSLEYRGLYLFLKHFLPEKDCFQLIYTFCEMALNLPSYTEHMNTMLSYIVSNSRYLNQQSESDIIQETSTHIRYTTLFPISIQSCLNQLNDLQEMYRRHPNDGFLQISDRILNNLALGLQLRMQNQTFYAHRMNMAYLNQITSVLASPIVKFRDGDRTILGNSTDEFVDDLALFSGILRGIQYMYNNESKSCPFATAPSLCNLEKTDTCRTNYRKINAFENYQGCIMSNAMKVTGVQKSDRLKAWFIWKKDLLKQKISGKRE
ncbi:hypothetical protein D3C71_512270 [compost metagenome]